MPAATATATAPPETPTLDRLALGLLLAFVGALQLSIAAAGVLFTATLLCWAALLVRSRVRPSAPPFFIALVAYAAITMVSMLFSPDIWVSFVDTKQLMLFLVVPAVYDLARGRRAATVVDVIITVGAASAVYGIVQYAMLHYDNLGQRPRGNLGHYMTYSGVLMLVLCTAVARLAFGARDRVWPALVLPALVVALALTLGRAAWIGSCVAVALLLALKNIRLLAILPVIVVAIFLLAPQSVTDRMLSIFDLQDASNRDRVAMARIGARMVQHYPLTGVGPDMVSRLYHEYRGPDAVVPVNPHLHNVPIQIAAERGLPALAIWVWLMAAMTVGLARLFRQSRTAVAAAGLAAVPAMLGAGLFEYNFGDSEFLMLFLVLVTLPFAAARRPESDGTERTGTPPPAPRTSAP